MKCHRTHRKGDADKVESKMGRGCMLDYKVAYLAKIMVLTLVNLSLKQVLVLDFTSQRVLSFRIRCS